MLKLRCLGGLHIVQDDQPVAGFTSTKAQALLCYLALADGPRLRTELASLFWSEMAEPRALKNLRMALSNLKHLLEPYVEITRQMAAFNRSAPYWVDAEEFLHKANNALRRESAAMLEEAVNLYKGDFLAGFLPEDAPLFEEWVFGQREHLRALAMQALYHLSVHHTKRGEYIAGIDVTSKLLQLEPWREEAHRQMMILLSRSGQRSAALAQFEKCKRILKQELDVEPMDATQKLYEQIKATGHDRRNNLPRPSTSLVGRSEELAELAQRLENDACRLLTLIGAGGVGKTRLALELACRMTHRFLDGAYFIPLDALGSAEFMPNAIAKALGLTLSDRQAPRSQLISYLHDKEILLVLDNFEHLMKGTSLVVDILRAAPETKILTTSRQRLELTWEWVFEVRGLEVPPLDGKGLASAESFSAADLFLKRAHQAKGIPVSQSELPPVVRICHLLEGIPLGIELAAAWTQIGSCQEVAGVLERRMMNLSTTVHDVPQRHRSLQATFDHSWELLSMEERELFKRLSVFRGGFTREAVCKVWCDTTNTSSADHLMHRLINKSLVCESASTQGRFYLLEPVRQYAWDKLVESGDAEGARNRHLDWCVQLAEEAEPKDARDQRSVLENLQKEYANLQMALSWSLEGGQEEAGLRLAGALYWFWERLGYQTEGRQWLTQLLAQDRHASSAIRANALNRAGQMWGYVDREQSTRLYEQSVALYRELGDKKGLARVLSQLGYLECSKGNYPQAKAACEESLALLREFGNKGGTGFVLIVLGALSRAQGNYKRAEAHYREALTIFQEIGNRYYMAVTFCNQGPLALDQGQHQRAMTLFTKSLELAREQGAKDVIFVCLTGFAGVATVERQPDRAVRLLGAVEGLLETSSGHLDPYDRADYDRYVAAARNQIDESAFARAWVEGRAMTLEQAIEYALAPEFNR